MESHSEFGRDTEDDTETDTKEQSDDGGIVIGAEVAGDEYSCPYSDCDDDDGQYRDDYAGDDDIVSPAGNIFGKSGGHLPDGVKSLPYLGIFNHMVVVLATKCVGVNMV